MIPDTFSGGFLLKKYLLVSFTILSVGQRVNRGEGFSPNSDYRLLNLILKYSHTLLKLCEILF